jgi:hypothetical protein
MQLSGRFQFYMLGQAAIFRQKTRFDKKIGAG